MRSFLFLKLQALCRLSKYLAIAGQVPVAYNDDEVSRCAEVLTSKADTIQKAAAALMLDLYLPGWRVAIPGLQGFVAERGDNFSAKWRTAVLKRDGHQCQKCGSVENLNAHHIVQWSIAPELRLDIENGRTLCVPCHKSVPVIRR